MDACQQPLMAQAAGIHASSAECLSQPDSAHKHAGVGPQERLGCTPVEIRTYRALPKWLKALSLEAP